MKKRKRFNFGIIFLLIFLSGTIDNVLGDGEFRFDWFWLLILIPVVIGNLEQIINYFKKDDVNQHTVTSNHNQYNPFEDTDEIPSKEKVECPYCSHMNDAELTFCVKCNGLL
ncbi:MAG: hypothetical protein K9L26_02110 [Candidatus Izimaplasma sp.]|nr:hypothetical protein [Candidatus Izimaplasma bacterium]